MGCISSKNARSDSPPRSRASATSSRNAGQINGNLHTVPSVPVHAEVVFGPLEKIKEESEEEVEEEEKENEEYAARRHGYKDYLANSQALKKETSERKVAFSIKFGRLTEGEHVAAGWPAWLSAAAGEAIDGWVPLKSDTFQRLEKVSYCTVFSSFDELKRITFFSGLNLLVSSVDWARYIQ